jgi:hypothetical protein
MGTPVSQAFTAVGSVEAEPMRHTLAVIDSVHGDGNLPPLIVRREVFDRYLGRFIQGQGVLIHPQARSPEFVTAHEMGHVLDFYGFT